MFISPNQIRHSLAQLAQVHPFFGVSFLAFKRAGLRVGTVSQIIISKAFNEILRTYYRPSRHYPGFYTPFFSSKTRGESHWVAPRYASTTLQRVTKDTFGDAFVHPKNSSEWAWQADYVERLRRHIDKPIPAFHLAVWLYRCEDWPPPATASALVDRFAKEFRITPDERRILFSFDSGGQVAEWLSPEVVGDEQLLVVIGHPPDTAPVEGTALVSLELRGVGPARHFSYQAAPRLNILAGDNSLGKTFLLDAIWWALTGQWAHGPLLPHPAAEKTAPRIVFEVGRSESPPLRAEATYDWDRWDWAARNRRGVPGVSIYGRHDGSFAIWDPAGLPDERESGARGRHTLRTADQVWVGLIADWPRWEHTPQYRRNYDALLACMATLLPEIGGPLLPGLPRRLLRDPRDIPTLRYSFGDVPLTQASAGVRRILSLIYVLIWAWSEHEIASSLRRQKPAELLVLLLDEVEAHLHPRWQRWLVPALLKALGEVSQSVVAQMHLATHSPLVLASTETMFEHDLDALHHLSLDETGAIQLERLAYAKEGRIDHWLTSPVFGLAQPRSLDAEQAISRANALQLREDSVTPDEVDAVQQCLARVLADDDEYWMLWRAFARAHSRV